LADNGQDCQRFRLDRANDGTYIFASVNGNRVVEVPVASTIAGTQLGLWDYNGCTCQRWTVSAVGTPTPIAAANLLMEVSLYPIPAVRGSFTVELGNQQSGVIGPALVQVFNLQGRKVYQQEFAPQQRKLAVDAALAGGVYLVQVRQGSKVLTQKVTVE
jgi:arabinan endo-1,5-alpha-L-arabinosidase